MAVKNKNRTKTDVRKMDMFGSKLGYEMFCVYWAYQCMRLNKNTVNKLEV